MISANAQTLPPDSATLANRIKSTLALKTKAYVLLQGKTVGSTLTNTERDAAIWVGLWNTGAINPATNKIDSTLNFIK